MTLSYALKEAAALDQRLADLEADCQACPLQRQTDQHLVQSVAAEARVALRRLLEGE